jgi:hypothetical protein
LIFRDESAKVVWKFKAEEARKKQASLSTFVTRFSLEDERDPDTSLEIVRSEDLALSLFSLAPPIEDQGKFPALQSLPGS